MKVKIKTWEEMEAEFGLDGGGIDCLHGFNYEMEKELPTERVVEVKYGEWVGSSVQWKISDDMIKEYL